MLLFYSNNLLEASRAINEEWFNYIYKELVDYVVYEVYFGNEIGTNLVNLVDSSLIDVKSNIKLNYNKNQMKK